MGTSSDVATILINITKEIENMDIQFKAIVEIGGNKIVRSSPCHNDYDSVSIAMEINDGDSAKAAAHIVRESIKSLMYTVSRDIVEELTREKK